MVLVDTIVLQPPQASWTCALGAQEPSVYGWWRMALAKPPTWWAWDLRITQHAELRMEQRGLTEVELREVLERAQSLALDAVEGRFVVTAVHLGRTWEVILEPDDVDRALDVITVYPLGRRP